MPAITPGRICLTLTGLATAIGPYVADWNKTHVKNPKWPPHAKFHNGQTMSTGLCLGLLTIYYTWQPYTAATAFSLRTAAIFGSLYGATALSGILYPGALAIDPEFGEGFPQGPLFLGNNNSYLVKRKSGGGSRFSRDPLNLMNKESRKYAGFVNNKAVGLHPTEKGGVKLVTKKTKHPNRPAANRNEITWAENTSGPKIYKGVVNHTAKQGYRADLRQEVVARASAIKESQRPKKENPEPKLRGPKAKKSEEKTT
ncbi:uncharacterized protein KY384_003697 [Bacidia gigantensis]|uniref:uncharacterized protein n=1 Tax=Bacidia gigantensis TaxID=2732470 RepID=UPI001D05528B|nr:uncharacterized protein KY384_003697 [Bacidia gigantensis]KAG8532060.1 hypothetical protein KY384_003697 [Bacidia gigantensis]